MRKSGVLLPITSLPSKYGIGCFSKEAYEFIDDLVEAGQTYWQILPLGPTGYGDSPYQSFSTYAGNPYLIDLESFIQEGYLTKDDCNVGTVEKNNDINYEQIYKTRFAILKKAYLNSEIRAEESFQQFVVENTEWLEDYAIYMAVKNNNDDKNWLEWEEGIKTRQPQALMYAKDNLKEEIECYKFQQFYFYKQWNNLKDYANEKGIKIVGDIPIYVASDSSDTWANPELFQVDHNCQPISVAGCPPDAFSETGQLWGNPLYRWEYHQKTGYEWWIKRIDHCTKLYDIIRVDHFRGFDEYYSIPSAHKTAEFGSWKQGPGYEIFKVLKENLGDLAIIAEDLGFLTESVLDLVKKTGYPGMKILQFAFDSREDSDYLPHNYHKNCIVYTGTHDNDTTVGWYDKLDKEDRAYVCKYLNITNDKEIHWELIRIALASVADTVIIPMQDYLGLETNARINTPSTVGNNWVWRMDKGIFTKELKMKMSSITKLYGRE